MPNEKTTLTVETTVTAPIKEVWKCWTTPEDIMHWNVPADDWHNLSIEVDLKDEGKFLFRMQAKDGSEGFDYTGKYDKVITEELVELTTSDGRKAVNRFIRNGDKTTITETFELDDKTPIDIQRNFCQNVLNNFRAYVENKLRFHTAE